jgi:hypothetical protein
MTDTKRTPAIAVDCILGETPEKDRLVLHPARGEPMTIWPAQFASQVRRYALLHGVKQKIVDAAAISRDPATGRSATPEVKFEAAKAVLYRLLAGEWNKPREGGAGTGGGLLLRALMRLYPTRSRDDLAEFVAAKSPEERAALRANPRVAAAIAELRAEGGEPVDTDGMLAELDGGDGAEGEAEEVGE